MFFAEAASVIKGIAKAIFHLHSLGIAHRDLKVSIFSKDTKK